VGDRFFSLLILQPPLLSKASHPHEHDLRLDFAECRSHPPILPAITRVPILAATIFASSPLFPTVAPADFTEYNDGER
jgi:hypothetical protein